MSLSMPLKSTHIRAVIVETIIAQDTPALFPHQLKGRGALEEPLFEHHSIVHNFSQLTLLLEKRLDGGGCLIARVAAMVVWCFVFFVLVFLVPVVLGIALALTFRAGLFLTEFTAFFELGG